MRINEFLPHTSNLIPHTSNLIPDSSTHHANIRLKGHILKASPFLKVSRSDGSSIKASVSNKLAKSPEPFPSMGLAISCPWSSIRRDTCRKY